MLELPTGVVTLLFTDVEGSTRLWEIDPDSMRRELKRHDTILTGGVSQNRGVVVKARGEGDSFFGVFGRAADAVAAALAIQRTLSTQQWATSYPIKVRMALHTGKVELHERDYYGPTVNRCARLRALGYGGQVLLSGVTAQLVEGKLPQDASLRDLGMHRLKDIATPERVSQLVHPDLQSDFPPIKSPDVMSSGAAQAQPSSAPRAVAGSGAEPATPQASAVARGYACTDYDNRAPGGRFWKAGATYLGKGSTEDGGANWLPYYPSPKMALLLNPMDGNFKNPNVWEVEVQDAPQTPGHTSVRALRVLPHVRLAPEDSVRFALLVALQAYRTGLFPGEFARWARAWLAGQDRSGEAARQIAKTAETDIYRVSPQNLGARVASTAAQAAAGAARAAQFSGRMALDEGKRAIDVAFDAVQIGTRVARLDLVGLASQAITDDESDDPLKQRRVVQA